MKELKESSLNFMDKSNSQGPLSRKQVTIVMAGIMLEVFIGSMNHMIVATAMPRIITDLGGFSQYTWIITIYLITSAAMMPLAGKLSDMYGRKWLYIIGITIFTTASLLCGMSRTMLQLIAFRGLQGVGFGIMMTLGMVILGDVFSPEERGKYMGFVMGVFGISAVIGPTLGGYLTDYLSWHYCFFINVPFGVVVIILFILIFPELHHGAVRHRIDCFGAGAMLLAMITLMLALTWGGRRYDWFSMRISGMLGFSALMFALFLRLESLSKEPIIPLWVFKNRIFTVSSISVFISGIAFFSGVTFIPLFLQGVLGTSATLSGNLLTPMMLGSVLGSISSGQLLSRAGGHYRIQAGIGFAVVAIGLFLLSRMTVETTYLTAVFNMVLVGVGNGIIMPLHLIAVQNAVPYSILGTATATLNLVRSFGGIFGLAILGSVMDNIFYSEFSGNQPPSINAAIHTEELLAIAKNPQALVNPEAQSQIRSLFESLGDQGDALFEQVLSALQGALNAALAHVFLISFGAIVLAFIVNFFLEEIPLRSSVQDEQPANVPETLGRKPQRRAQD
jgi:EmrB/QacA subfamily drug resistance transporter